MNISLVCITMNQPKNLNRMLSVMSDYFAECVIVSGSDDKETRQVCEQFGARYFFKPWNNNFSEQRNFAISKVSYKWVLSIDDDEFMEFPLLAYLQDIAIDENLNKVFAFTEKNFYRFEKWKRNEDLMDWGRCFPTRLFPADCRYVGTVHETLEKNGKYFVIVPHEYGSIVHEKTMTSQKIADVLYQALGEGGSFAKS